RNRGNGHFKPYPDVKNPKNRRPSSARAFRDVSCQNRLVRLCSACHKRQRADPSSQPHRRGAHQIGIAAARADCGHINIYRYGSIQLMNSQGLEYLQIVGYTTASNVGWGADGVTGFFDNFFLLRGTSGFAFWGSVALASLLVSLMTGVIVV